MQVFAEIYPVEGMDFVPLKSAVEKLTLNDASVQKESCTRLKKHQRTLSIELLIFSTSLGAGWRLGFHGLLHLDIFKQRLEEAGIRYTL